MGSLVQEENRQYPGFYPGLDEIKKSMPEEYGQRKGPDFPGSAKHIACGADDQGMFQENENF
ncbi:MAG: hypothetical protein WBC70_15170 [Candidatus Aminicenantales bacterium]